MIKSDVDIVVFEASAKVPSSLFKLKNAMTHAGIYSQIEVIDKAKVPIIKMVDALTGLNVDICFNMSGGVESAKIVKQFLQDKQCGPALRPLMLILKQFLHQRHLNEVYMGGLGSYGLLIMIASFLKLHPLIQSKAIDPCKNLGVLLIEFFELYGRTFNYDKLGIGLDSQRSWYYKKDYSKGNRLGFLSLLDPQDSSNDVGKGSYNYGIVKSEFFKAYNLLTALMGEAYEKECNSFRKRVTSVLGFIITFKKEVLELRDSLEKIYEEIQQGYHKEKLPTPIRHKRVFTEFVVDETDDSEEEKTHKKQKILK